MEGHIALDASKGLHAMTLLLADSAGLKAAVPTMWLRRQKTGREGSSTYTLCVRVHTACCMGWCMRWLHGFEDAMRVLQNHIESCVLVYGYRTTEPT